MKAQDIQQEMVLELKADRQAAYGMDSPLVIVSGFKYHKGYKVPYIVTGEGYFKPSDFKRSLTERGRV